MLPTDVCAACTWMSQATPGENETRHAWPCTHTIDIKTSLFVVTGDEAYFSSAPLTKIRYVS